MATLRGWQFWIFAVCVLGCTPPRPPTLRVQLNAEPASLDPVLAEDGVSLKILNNTMDGLVAYDGAGQLQKRLASSWKITSQGRRYEFTLRKDARWSDGIAVTPQDFAVGFRRAMDSRSASKLVANLSSIDEVRVEGDRFIILLKRANPLLLDVLTLPVALPERADILAKNGGRWPKDSAQAPVTGPYQIVQHRIDQKIVMTSNPYHWRNSTGRIRQVEWVIVNDEVTAMTLFEAGKLDVLTKVSSLDVSRLRAAGKIHTAPLVATYFIAFNSKSSAFREAGRRKAVACAIDRHRIVRALDTGETPAFGLIPPGIEGFTSLSSLTCATHPKIRWDSNVRLGFDTSQRNALVMEMIQHDLNKNAGLNVQLFNQDWRSHLRTLQTEPPPIFRFGWLAPYMDPITHLRAFTCHDLNNYTGWCNSKFDHLIEDIESMTPGADRAKKILLAENILISQEFVVVPIYHYVQVHAVSPRVKGFKVNPFGVVRFEDLEVADSAVN